jgi:hypothetical protein
MGLGKSLSLLALICSSLDFFEEHPTLLEKELFRATLIIAPKSSTQALACFLHQEKQLTC